MQGPRHPSLRGGFKGGSLVPLGANALGIPSFSPEEGLICGVKAGKTHGGQDGSLDVTSYTHTFTNAQAQICTHARNHTTDI